MPAIHRLTLRDTPILVSMPHCGTALPDELRARMTEAALPLPDTDWHLPQLYDFLPELGIATLVPIHSRYVVDLNRDPDGKPLYAGASNSELCPLTTFAYEPIYREGVAPDEAEIAARVASYWRPYHAAIGNALAHLRQRHGVALLFEAHSIASRVPRFFEGRLPDFNLGSDAGRTLPVSIMDALRTCIEAHGRYDYVIDGRFKGGYITRAYARPADGIYSVQLELSQAVYMLEDGRYAWEPAQAAAVQPLLRRLFEVLLAQLGKPA